jgi:tRNA G18 (ribose-2'-O)-methylase SpoU
VARPTILVMGNEGRHQPIGVDSLNVSVATGILLHQLLGS